MSGLLGLGYAVTKNVVEHSRRGTDTADESPLKPLLRFLVFLFLMALPFVVFALLSFYVKV